MWSCLQRNEAQLSVIIAAATALIALVGFYAAWCQLSRTEEVLRAANTYQVQKDGRELLEKLNADDAFVNLLNSGLDSNDPVFQKNIWLMLNFYQSVYRQSLIDGLSLDFVKSFSADFCEFVKRPTIQILWEKFLTDKRLSNSHVEMRRDWCR